MPGIRLAWLKTRYRLQATLGALSLPECIEPSDSGMHRLESGSGSGRCFFTEQTARDTADLVGRPEWQNRPDFRGRSAPHWGTRESVSVPGAEPVRIAQVLDCLQWGRQSGVSWGWRVRSSRPEGVFWMSSYRLCFSARRPEFDLSQMGESKAN